MNYFDNKKNEVFDKVFYLYVFTEALRGIRTGEYKVDENGVFLEDTYLDILCFNVKDDETQKIVSKYLAVSYQPGMEEPWIDFPETLLGPGNEKLVVVLCLEIQKKQQEGGIKDRWREYYSEKLEKIHNNKNSKNDE